MFSELRDLLLDSSSEELGVLLILKLMGVALVCGLVIYATYRFFHRGIVYSENFNILLVLTCLITTFIIITIGSNLVLSLGMVGALSIVRFRAAIKEPLDVGFLFWTVAVGLTAGARLPLVALVGTGTIAVVYILLTFLRIQKKTFLLILRYSPTAEQSVAEKLKDFKHKLKNKTETKTYIEYTAEVAVKKNDTSQKFIEINGVESVILVEYSGDYT